MNTPTHIRAIAQTLGMLTSELVEMAEKLEVIVEQAHVEIPVDLPPPFDGTNLPYPQERTTA